MTVAPEVSRVLDDATFEAFYARVYPVALGYLIRLGATGDDAQDIAQEAMLRTWRWVRDGQAEHKAQKYLFTTARRLLIDQSRGRRTVPLPDFDDHVGQTAACPVTAAERAEERRGLARALALLPASDRDLLLASTVHGLPDSELAAQYETSEGALRVRRFRTRQRLREHVAYLRAPAVMPLIRLRLASCRGWVHDVAERVATPSARSVRIFVAACGLAVVPFPGPGGGAEPAGRGALPARHPTETAAPGARGPWFDGGPEAASIRHSRRSQGVAATGARSQPAHVPQVCGGDTCSQGEPYDDLTVHLPHPVGDQHVRQGTVPICATAPDSAVGECQTDGSPDYAVPPPPPV